ncbi:MAG: inositol monophosphatase [Candidatus Kerfeldbacteria bacterium]|nr:inositol monophosphatase [Candidatus Kerfeldbacteria bacterium]
MKQYTNVAIQAARLAGHQLMKRFRHVTTQGAQRKGRHDIVTHADMEANDIILHTIRRHFPQHDFLSEETGLEDNTDTYRWTIDPLDGTVNFALQSPLFCTTLALLHQGEVLCGVIYAPFVKELYVAEAGAGAWLNGKRLRVSTTHRLSDALVLIGRTHHPISHRNYIMLQRRLDQCVFNSRYLGSGSLNLAYTAVGRSDATVMTPPGVSAWDAPAGVLMVREAGGRVTNMDGKPWHLQSTGVVASNGKIHNALIRAIS